MQDVELAWGSATDTGLRSDNQDSALARPPVFAVADGMGGHAAGREASDAAVAQLDTITDAHPLTVERVRAALREADDRIRRTAATLKDKRGMGTTVAGMALVDVAEGAAPGVTAGPCWAVFHVGDSRVYRLAGGRLDRISTDHSVVQELLQLGLIGEDDVADHPQRHLITRALGVGSPAEADVALLPIEAGQRFLVCSDGLTGELPDVEIAELLGGAGSAGEAADELVRTAATRGASDNVTAVVVEVVRVFPVPGDEPPHLDDAGPQEPAAQG